MFIRAGVREGVAALVGGLDTPVSIAIVPFVVTSTGMRPPSSALRAIEGELSKRAPSTVSSASSLNTA